MFNLWKATGRYAREYTRFSRNARLFLLSFFFSGLWFSGYILFFNFYLKSLHYDEATVGLLNAIPTLAGVVFALPAGYLSDRIGRKKMLLFSTLLGAVGFLGMCFSESIFFLCLTLLVSSFAEITIWTLTAPFMADNSQAEDRTQLFSLQFALGTLTNFIGSLGGGFLPRLFGGWLGTAPESTASLRATLLTAGLCIVLSLVPLLFLTENPRPVRVPAKAAPTSPSGRRKLPKVNSLILWLILPDIMVGLGAGMTIPFLNVYVSGKFGVEFETLGLLFGFAELSTTLAVFIQPLLARRFGKVRSIVLFQGLSLPFLLLLGFGPYFWMVAIALYVRGALMQAANPVYQVFIQEQVPPTERATASAFLSVADSLARGSGSAFSGFLRGGVGAAAGFNILFGIMIVCYTSSITLFYFRFRHTDDAPVEEAPSIAPAQARSETDIPGVLL